MEHYEEIELVTPAKLKINYVHDTVSLLKQVEGLFPLLSLDKLDC